MSSAYWGIISDSILLKLRNSPSSFPAPDINEMSSMVYVLKLFCELNVRARTSFGGTVNPVEFPPSGFFLSECLQSAFVYICNVNNLGGDLPKHISDDNLSSNVDSRSSRQGREVRANSFKRSAEDIFIIPPMEAEQNKHIKLAEQSLTTTTAAAPSMNPTSGTQSSPTISETLLPKIEQIIRSFCQSKHIRANKTGEGLLTKAPLQQQEQQDIFNILQQPFYLQQSSQQQHMLWSPAALLQSLEKVPQDGSPTQLPDPLPHQIGQQKEFTRRHKKHPNRYVLTIQNPRFRPLSPGQPGGGGGSGDGGGAETIVKLTYGHIHQVCMESDSSFLPPPLPESVEGGSDGRRASSVFLSISLITALKGLEVLSNNRYRVQLNTPLSNTKKLSKNTTCLYEAFWIFEISLLISDQPKMLDRLLRDGNYSSLSVLSCFGFFRSPTEYYFELLRMLLVFYERNLYFRNDLMDIAIANFDEMKPSDLVEGTAIQSIGKGSFELSSGLLLNGMEKEHLNFRPMCDPRSPSPAAMARHGTKTLLPVLSAASGAAPVQDDLSDDDIISESSSDMDLDLSATAAVAKEQANPSNAITPSSSASAGQTSATAVSEPLSMNAVPCILCDDAEIVPEPPLLSSEPIEPLSADATECDPLVRNLKQRVVGYKDGLSLKDQGLSCRNFQSSFFQALHISDSAPYIITVSANTPKSFDQMMRPVGSMRKHV
eukprot:gene29584-38704_t